MNLRLVIENFMKVVIVSMFLQVVLILTCT